LNESDIYREWAPPLAWRHAVVCCWSHVVATEHVHRVVPDGCADLIVDASGTAEVVGVADEFALPQLSSRAQLFGIRLRPEAVAPAFRVDAVTLRNRTVGLADVLGARASRVLATGDRAAADRWIRSLRPDPRAIAARQLLADHSVDATATIIGVSSRQLQRIMLSKSGLTPKAFQRIARFRRFLMGAERGASLAAAAAHAGYADQSHLTREVLRLSGLSPAALLVERGVRPLPRRREHED